MKKHPKTLGLILILASSMSFADGRLATRNLFKNLSTSGSNIGIAESGTQVSPTLVNGIYLLTNQQGRFIGFINEAGTLYGDSNGFMVIPTNGEQPRAMSPSEVADLRADVLASIDYNHLPKITYGDGGGRRLVMFSAIDCPACKFFEDSMQKFGGNMNTTIYVVPLSLRNIASGGLQQWQTVSRIWCAENSSTAWKDYWASKTIPQPRQCRFSDPQVAESSKQQLMDILKSIGIRVTATPQFVREDGYVINSKPDIDIAYMNSVFGSAGMPQVNTKPTRWLMAGSADGLQTQPVDGQTTTQQSRQKIGINDALMNLKKMLGN